MFTLALPVCKTSPEFAYFVMVLVLIPNATASLRDINRLNPTSKELHTIEIKENFFNHVKNKYEEILFNPDCDKKNKINFHLGDSGKVLIIFRYT